LKNAPWSREDGVGSMSLPRSRRRRIFRHDGLKDRSFAPLPDVLLEDLVPKNNLYRRLEVTLDLSFVRELVRPLYAGGGRPSVNPVVFFLTVAREYLLCGSSS
jgi:hypothetical protein